MIVFFLSFRLAQMSTLCLDLCRPCDIHEAHLRGELCDTGPRRTLVGKSGCRPLAFTKRNSGYRNPRRVPTRKNTIDELEKVTVETRESNDRYVWYTRRSRRCHQQTLWHRMRHSILAQAPEENKRTALSPCRSRSSPVREAPMLSSPRAPQVHPALYHLPLVLNSN